MKYETEKDWCLRLYAFVGLGYLATYYVLAKFAAPLRWRDLCFFPAGCYEVVFSWQAVAAAVVSAVQAMFLACSRLRAAKLMWLCAAGWLGAAAFVAAVARRPGEANGIATEAALATKLPKGSGDTGQTLSCLCILAIGHKADERKPQNEDKLKWESVHLNKY